MANTNNIQAPIPAASNEKFMPTKLIHKVLTVKVDTKTGAITFEIGDPTGPPQPPSDLSPQSINDYAKAVALLPKSAGQPFRPSQTPYDIHFNGPDQHWILVELAHDAPLDWQFAVGGWATTTKEAAVLDNHFGLRHAYRDGTADPVEDIGNPQPTITGDGCRVFYFAIARQLTGSCLFNFHVEIKQGSKTMVIVFDPDVPNDGPDVP